MADTPFNYSGKLAFLSVACVDVRLNRSALAVLSVLLAHANMTTGETFVSVATIVTKSKVPKSTALRAIRQLEDCGWMATERKFGASSRYRLTGSEDGTGSTIETSSTAGTGAIQNQTGAIQNLRRGQTGVTTGAEPVPPPEPEQKKAKATEVEQKSTRGKFNVLNSPAIPREEFSDHDSDELYRQNLAALEGMA